MKKVRSLVAILMCLSLLLVACGTTPASSTSTEASTSSTTPSSVAPSVAPSSAPEVVEAVEETKVLTGTLNLWTMWNDTESQGEAMQKIATNFEAAYPGTTVKIQWAGRELSKTLKPALESGEVIDIFDYPLQYGGQLGFYCLDLSDAIAEPFDALGGKTLKEVLLPSMLETPKAQIGVATGQIAVGYKPWANLMMYNAKLFAEVGITSTPTTWEELDAACAKLKEGGYSPITFDDAYAHWVPGMYLAREKGQDWVKELAMDSTGELWRDEAVVNMAKAFEDFATKGYFDENVGGNKWPAGQMDLGSGKAGMYYNLTGLPTEVKEVTGDDFKWGAFNFPDVVAGQTRSKNEAPTGCTMTAIHTKSEQKDLAIEFLAFMHSEESDAIMVDNGMTTARKDGTWPPALVDVKPAFDAIEVILQTGGGIEANADIKPVFAENFIKLAAGQITADQFVENMATAATK